MKKINIALFSTRQIGFKIFQFLNSKKMINISYHSIHEKDLNIYNNKFNYNLVFNKKNKKKNWEIAYKELKKSKLQFCILAWWPYIVPNKIINLKDLSIINLHPSFLPYGRGKDSNFWSIVDRTPYGVSIMKINKNIDEGDVFVKKKINYSITDNSEKIYNKALKEIFNLFKGNIIKILQNKIKPIKQDLRKTKTYFRKDMLDKSHIKLFRKYKAIDLINVIRAKKFKNFGKAFFTKNKKKYEIEIKINEKKL